MARPQKEILLSRQVTDHLGVDVVVAQGLWAILYKNKPVNIRHRYWTMNGECNKYHKVVYPSPAPAKNLAAKLNLQFNTTEFTVTKIL